MDAVNVPTTAPKGVSPLEICPRSALEAPSGREKLAGRRGVFAFGWAGPVRRYSALPSRLRLGAALTVILVLLALCVPWLAPYPPDLVHPEARLHSPSPAHWFGTDALGRDNFSRVLYGARLALISALVGTGTAAALGIPLGLLAGYYGGRLDRGLSRVIEVWLGFPPLLLAIVIVARLGPSLTNAVVALGIVSAPFFFRITRSALQGLRCSGYIEAARALGARDLRILVRHLLPNIAPSLIVLTTMRMGRMIVAGGALSFVGLGAQVPTPEWGALLAIGRDYLTTAPWLAIFPGIAITLSVLGMNLLGEGLRDLFDIHSRMPANDVCDAQ